MSAYDRLQKSLEYMYNYIIPDLYNQIQKAKSCGAGSDLKIHCDFKNCQCTFDGELDNYDDLQKHITVSQFQQMMVELLTRFEEGVQDAVNQSMESYVDERFAGFAAGEGIVTDANLEEKIEAKTSDLSIRVTALEQNLESNVSGLVRRELGDIDPNDICARSHVDAEMEWVHNEFNSLQNQYVDFNSYNMWINKLLERTSYLLIKLRELDPEGRYEWNEVEEYKQQGKI